ncbi:MAG: hypothetical protein Q8L22_04165, partial [Reyranella sp.]|nr:hypothetical protein [Reyranella sp.]
ERAMTKDRYVTDQTLQDYLRKVVPEFVTGKLNVSGTQTPYAVISGTNTFLICSCPKPEIIPDADLAWLKPLLKSSFYEAISEGRIRQLDGFSKRNHFIAEKVTEATSAFVASLLADKIAEEVDSFQGIAKEVFELSRRELTYASGHGEGNVDTPAFRLSIKGQQHPTDINDYQIVRRLKPRSGADLEKVDEVFGSTFKTLVYRIDASKLDFNDLANRLDDIARATGARVEEEMVENRITFVTEAGSRAEIDIGRSRIVFKEGGESGCVALAALPQKFGL